MMADEALHPLTNDLVDRFARALKEKLLASQIKYGWADDWARDDWQERCQASLLDHIGKGDPRDVAAFAAFMWHHDWPTATRPAPKADSALVEELVPCPFCGDPEPYLEPTGTHFRIACSNPDCAASGPSGPSEGCAVGAWNGAALSLNRAAGALAALSDRNVVLEEAAKVAEDWMQGSMLSGDCATEDAQRTGKAVAQAIRALKGGVDE